MLYLLQGGFGETVIEFDKDYERSWLAASVLSSLAGVNGDTWASEIGTVVAKMEPRLITSLQKVPVGTNGGFTAAGLFFSALGGSIIGLAYLLALVLCYRNVVLHQVFLLTCMGAFAGLFGSIIDSVIGATLQYSGLDMRTGKIVENPAIGVKHISGRPLLNNHSVNMIMSIINSIVVPTITARLYLFFM
ncbi:Transmembrane protein 19, partial [Stegodyphus mimosarum]